MKQLLFAALFGLSLSACAQSPAPAAPGATPAADKDAEVKEAAVTPGTPEARVREVLRGINPNIRIERIGPAPIPGFREVIATGQVVYVSDDGKYLFQGGLMDIPNRRDMGEVAMAGVRREVLATLPLADRIVFAPTGAAKHTVTVLTDVECGYCRKFHSDIAEYNKRGIRVEYLAFPRAGLGSPDYRKMVAVWCAPDRRKALTDAKNDKAVPDRACPRTPVDMQYRAGQRMGLEGTPMIINDDGRVLGGYLAPDALLQRLDALKAEKTRENSGAPAKPTTGAG